MYCVRRNALPCLTLFLSLPQAAKFNKAMEEIIKLRISEIKKELDLFKVSHKGFFEKKEFAEALAKARLSSGKIEKGICVCRAPSHLSTYQHHSEPRRDI